MIHLRTTATLCLQFWFPKKGSNVIIWAYRKMPYTKDSTQAFRITNMNGASQDMQDLLFTWLIAPTPTSQCAVFSVVFELHLVYVNGVIFI